jgi:predicted phosphoribosyltransferase
MAPGKMERMMIFRQFQDRTEAGLALAKALSAYTNKQNVLVLALPRGGVPIADAVAKELSLPMDVWLVRKLGVPWQEEFAMGAVSMGGICHVDSNIVSGLGIPDSFIQETVARERAELDRRNKLYRHDKPAPDLQGKTVIVVDDGIATGATMHAAVLSLREARAQRIVVAVPVGSASACSTLENIADEVVCAHMPEPFYGVGQWYRDFSQTSDDEVLEILNQKTEARA